MSLPWVHYIVIIMDDEGADMAVMGNRRVYVDEALFFRLLQDVGQQMSNKEKDRFVKNKSRAAVKGKVHFEGLMYPHLYKLAKEMYNKMGENTELFPRLPNQKNKTKAIHSIGKMFAKKRIFVARSDIHYRPQSKVDLELFNSVEYAAKNDLFVLPQQDIIKLCHAGYGKLAMSRKPTTDNSVRAVGIAITDEDIRQLLTDMLGKTKGGTHSELDAAASWSCQGFNLLHGKFVDKEVVVTLPE